MGCSDMALIDREELYKEICRAYEYEYPTASGAFDEFVSKTLKNIIYNAPTVEEEPVRHGKIIETIKDGKYHREFSCCGRDFTQLTMWYMPRFCPNCGAKMED